jgi:hypothetical protein
MRDGKAEQRADFAPQRSAEAAGGLKFSVCTLKAAPVPADGVVRCSVEVGVEH